MTSSARAMETVLLSGGACNGRTAVVEHGALQLELSKNEKWHRYSDTGTKLTGTGMRVFAPGDTIHATQEAVNEADAEQRARFEWRCDSCYEYDALQGARDGCLTCEVRVLRAALKDAYATGWYDGHSETIEAVRDWQSPGGDEPTNLEAVSFKLRSKERDLVDVMARTDPLYVAPKQPKAEVKK